MLKSLDAAPTFTQQMFWVFGIEKKKETDEGSIQRKKLLILKQCSLKGQILLCPLAATNLNLNFFFPSHLLSWT